MNPLVLRGQVIEHRKRAKGFGCALLGLGHVIAPTSLSGAHQNGPTKSTPEAISMQPAKPPARDET